MYIYECYLSNLSYNSRPFDLDQIVQPLVIVQRIIHQQIPGLYDLDDLLLIDALLFSIVHDHVDQFTLVGGRMLCVQEPDRTIEDDRQLIVIEDEQIQRNERTS